MAKPHGPRSSEVPGKCPKAREAGEAPFMGPTGILRGSSELAHGGVEAEE